jgi:DNA repair exonuclease SbcCD ATPase subunit
MSTDFFDDDLVKPDTGANTDGADATSAEAAAARLSLQREQLTTQVADAAEEIERLRMRQEELEREKDRLAELNRKQEAYESGKREMIDQLTQAIALMEKDELQATRMVELLSAGRARFKDMLTELRAIRESTWTDGVFPEELAKALALVENARLEYGRAMAKIDAATWQRSDNGQTRLATIQKTGMVALADRGFWFWVRVGLAFCLPLILVLLALFAGYLYSMGW